MEPGGFRAGVAPVSCPFLGVADLWKEGPKYAVRERTEEKRVVVHL
jgi:hypothetical protein